MWAKAQLHSFLISTVVPHRFTDDSNTVSHLPEISILQAHSVLLADEGGPALKKLRSTTHGVEKASKSVAGGRLTFKIGARTRGLDSR
jgi:hypothetical protein